MTGKQKILVVVEFENEPAVVVERAAWLATLLDCDLELLLCDPDASSIGMRPLLSNEAEIMSANIEAAQQELLSDLEQIAKAIGIKATSSVLHERPIADGILSLALDMNPKMIIKGTHYHSASERNIIVGTDWQLMRMSPCQLYLVKRSSFKEKPTVIAAVDPMHDHDRTAALDQLIIENAKLIVDKCDGELHLFHSYQRLVAIGHAASWAVKSGTLPIDEIDRRTKKEHREALNTLASRYDIEDKHVHQLPGRTHELLPAFVRSKAADLVVIGALARWGLKRMLVGSTAERVLDHLPCDLLIVRAE